MRQSSGRNPISHDYSVRDRGRGRCNISKSNISDVLSWFSTSLNMKKLKRPVVFFLWISGYLTKYLTLARVDKSTTLGPACFWSGSRPGIPPHLVSHSITWLRIAMTSRTWEVNWWCFNHLFWWFGVIWIKQLIVSRCKKINRAPKIMWSRSHKLSKEHTHNSPTKRH